MSMYHIYVLGLSTRFKIIHLAPVTVSPRNDRDLLVRKLVKHM